MSLTTIIWSMIASACLTLAGIHLLVWGGNRKAWANILFSLTAASTAAWAFCELRMMRSGTPAEFATTLKWAHIPVWLLVVSLVWYVRLYLKAGRTWLAWMVCGLRTLALVFNFLVGQDLNYIEITQLRHIPFLGESASVPVGVPNPWMVIGQLSLVLLIIFAADASVTVWRRGDRHSALTVGGSIVFFSFASTGQSMLVFWGIVQVPITASLFFMGLVTVMGYELSREAVRASRLDRELQESHEQAEQEAQKLRQEIAHVGRISMLGQLASALAHEINQPLGAILRNAEAAELFMQAPSPDLDEIRAILADIREDDQRAGAVIDRMRGLLKRRNLDKRPVVVGELVGEVIALVRSDAAARHVGLEVIVGDGLPNVCGDRVHLQQVLLNLIVNGMDALGEANGHARSVRVTALLDGAQTVEIAVSDSGHGIAAERLPHIFDPFFTTKPNGLGMGLPISRTIVEAHGGRLWAENSQDGGAAFRFTLPIVKDATA